MRTLLLLVAASLLFVSAAGAQPGGAAERLPSVELPPEVERVLRDYEHAWRARDAAALAALFTHDGFALRPGRPPARGEAAIEQAYRGAGGPLHLRALAYEASGTVAYVVGAYSARAGLPDGGKFVLVLRRDADGRWRIVADIDNGNG